MAKVLIVDDSLIMRKKLKMILTKAGHEIVGEAVNGLLGVKEYNEKKPDIVTMDITMPVMNGIESVKNIISAHPEAKIIMVSGLNQEHMVFEAIEKGAKHYIVKPINESLLISIIAKIIGNNEQKMTDNIPSFSIFNNNGEFIIEIKKNLKQNDNETLSKLFNSFSYFEKLNTNIKFAKQLQDDDLNTAKTELQKLSEVITDENRISKYTDKSFSISNKNADIILSISKVLGKEEILELETVTDGLLCIHPLQVKFNLSSQVQKSENIMNSLNKMISNLKKAEGTVEIISE